MGIFFRQWLCADQAENQQLHQWLSSSLTHVCTTRHQCFEQWQFGTFSAPSCYLTGNTPFLAPMVSPFTRFTDASQTARFMGPTWGPPGSCRPQMGPMLAPWTLLSGMFATSGPQCVNILRPRQMEASSQTTFSIAFSWMKMFEFRLKFPWSLFPRVQLTIFQHWLDNGLAAWRRPGDKPLSEPMVVSLPTPICVARSQCVNYCTEQWQFSKRNKSCPMIRLSHSRRDKTAVILLTTFSNSVSCMEIVAFWCKFHRNSFPNDPFDKMPVLVQIMAWCRTGHYLNQCQLYCTYSSPEWFMGCK